MIFVKKLLKYCTEFAKIWERKQKETKSAPAGAAACGGAETVKKTSLKMSGTEQRGVCAGGKKPTARSINRILKRF